MSTSELYRIIKLTIDSFRADPGSGNLITFLQFLFIAVHGFIATAKFGTVKPRIGLKDYTILVAMFFIVSVCNNYAFDFNIPMPLHMIFRAVRFRHFDFSRLLSFLLNSGFVDCQHGHGNYHFEKEI